MTTTAKLYSFGLSHPARAAQLMLERKGIEHEVKDVLAGFHPLRLRAAGFKRGTIPALKIDGRRIQGSSQIAAALEEIKPTPPLFPGNVEERRAVIQAEEWGEAEFQPIPRRLIRWGYTDQDSMRRWLVATIWRLPGVGLQARASVPLVHYFARTSGATEAAVRSDLKRLPALLNHVERLVDAGTIGGAEPNAADFQIGTTARLNCLRERPPVTWGCKSSPNTGIEFHHSCRRPGCHNADPPGKCPERCFC